MKKSNIMIVSSVIIVGLAVIGAVLWFSFFSQRDEAEVVIREQAKERSEDVLLIGMEPNYPPMEFLDSNSNLAGYDVDLIKEALPRMRKNYEIVPIAWDKKTELLNDGTIDLIWSGMNITNERKQIYSMSKAYAKYDQIFVVPQNSDIYTQEQLAHKRVGIEAGTFIVPMLEEMSNKNPEGKLGEFTEYSGAATAMTGMLAGEVDVVVSSNVTVGYYAANSPGKFRILPGVLWESEGAGVAARKGDTALINEVDRVLDDMRADGTLSRISQKWFGQ